MKVTLKITTNYRKNILIESALGKSNEEIMDFFIYCNCYIVHFYSLG